jgi:hypothetical protein
VEQCRDFLLKQRSNPMDKAELEQMRNPEAYYLKIDKSHPDGAAMIPDKNGAYVLAYDYRKLLDHIDALEQRLAEYKPVDAVLIGDCDEGSDKRYGRVLVTTENCIQTLYRHEAIAAAPEPQEVQG